MTALTLDQRYDYRERAAQKSREANAAGMSYRQISDAYSVSVGSVWRWVHAIVLPSYSAARIILGDVK